MAVLLTGCGLGLGGRPPLAAAPAQQGPAADFPMVLGAPFTVDGKLYTPADTMNYDEVGFATLDSEGGNTISAAHRTLPLPSYVEITSLETGRTILVRMERRGPMTGSSLVALSPGAAAQLGASDHTPVRVRRVNPPEQERAMLRSGGSAAERMATPMSLVTVLKRKLPGYVTPPTEKIDAPQAAAAPSPIKPAPVVATPTAPKPVTKSAPIAHKAEISPKADKPPAGAPPAAQPPATKGFVVQAGAFSMKENAARVASKIGGHIEQSGKLFIVRTGPYADRSQADAALAKAKGAGYSGARIYPTE